MLVEQIIYLRTSAGMTQRKLAKELHVSLSAIGMYEQGRRTPSIDILIQMANLFDVSLDYLITGKEFTGQLIEKMDTAAQEDCPCRRCHIICNGKKTRNKNDHHTDNVDEQADG